ncbi:DUF3014 domain-containing protein [Thalassotalea nanhaiensis]|uniref:DUF3014 domain-containing protein n=1 Tax=Thalassotalea nanhaiensis TaxID=3065648 RepID=A0ABY9TMY3_9GAMM|nr:DUF3014 domain-containing protein [Colwelliaceae bacterium SQ345]
MSEEHSNIESSNPDKNASSTLVFIIILVVVIGSFAYLFFQEDEVELTPVIQEEVIAEPEVIVPVKTETIIEPTPVEVPVEAEIEPEIVQPVLPELDVSDDFVVAKVTEISWRKELLSLMLTDDLVRRIVVFTDNFSRGEMAYSHLPLKPLTGQFAVKPSVDETQDSYQFNESNFTRYADYIELLHSFEPEALASNFIQMKPLFEQAFAELGYPEQNFEQVLNRAIDRVLDFNVPSEQPTLVQPSVVYKYENPEFESLADADKFLLRLGKENLLQLKAIALELDNQLNMQNNQ